ncbi:MULTISPECIES: type IV pilus modification protein PilV [unclassified Vreelandella]
MKNAQRGVSLLEALIAMLIMSIGLLGVVALQTQALSQQRSAYLETQATNMAQDMLDRIRANKEDARAYALTPGQPSSGSGLVASDTQGWVRDLADVLPQGLGEVVVTPPEISVTVSFEEPSSPGERRRIQLVSEL